MKKIGLTIALATQLFFSSAAQQISQQHKDSLYTTIISPSLRDSLISDLNLDQIRDWLLDGMNSERQSMNNKYHTQQYKPFATDNILNQVAQNYAEHMVSTGRFDHIDENWKNAKARVEVLIPRVSVEYAEIGENLAKWQHTINDIISTWMHESSSHRLSILSGITNYVGIGYCNGICVVIFGTKYE